MDGLSVEVDLTNEETPRLVLRGELDLAQTEDLRAALDSIEGYDPTTLVVDTTELDFIDSRGLGVLVEARNRFGADTFTLVPGEATLRILEVSGTKDYLIGP